MSHSGAYNFNQINSPRSLVWDASYTMTRRYRCVNGAMVGTIEAFTFAGSATGVMHDGRSVAVSVSTGDVVPDALGRTGCPPSILNFLTEDADGAYRVIMDALAVEYVNRHGLVSGTGLAIGLSPDFNGAPVFVPGLHALGYTESCGTFRDVSGWFIGDVGQISGPGSSHSFSAFANCGQAQYRSVNTWNLAGSPAGTIAGQFTSAVTAAVDITVLQPCNPDPCTGEPPPPPPPPPPGYGACYLRDGTCLVTTAMDCYNRTFFEYRAGENCPQGRGCANCGQDGGL